MSSIQNSALWHSARESSLGLVCRSTHRFVRDIRHLAHPKRGILPNLEQITESIAAIDAFSSDIGNEEPDTEAPIFLLASGWRTGSTLLQRILVTDPAVILWGEPLGDVALVSKLAEMLAQVPTFSKVNRRAIEGKPAASQLATSWIANLCPPGEDLRPALRMLFDRWLGEPAVKRGFARWGFKEVRLGAAEAMVLHWLYPRAKFLFLTRHPYDCYRSLADSGWDQVYHRRPDLRIESAADFARHWNRLVVSLSELPADFPCFRIRYEDLVNGEVDFRALETWLGINLTEKIALSVIVGHSSSRPQLAWHERWIISREAAPGMRSLGYSSNVGPPC